MSFVATAAIPLKLLALPAGPPGPGTIVQPVPSPCSTNVLSCYNLPIGPTAQTSLAETTATALRLLTLEASCGLSAIFHSGGQVGVLVGSVVGLNVGPSVSAALSVAV